MCEHKIKKKISLSLSFDYYMAVGSDFYPVNKSTIVKKN